MNEIGFSEIDFDVASKERENSSQVKIISLSGMDDLPTAFNNVISTALKSAHFESRWKSSKEEGIEEKIERLDRLVEEYRNSGKEIIFIGISAGGDLGLLYMLRHPDKVRHMYSLSGCLNPNLQIQEMSYLANSSKAFKEMAEKLGEKENSKKIEKYRLNERVSTYYSEDDTVVPSQVSNPDWVKNNNQHGESRRDHIKAISSVMFGDKQGHLRELQKARFD